MAQSAIMESGSSRMMRLDPYQTSHHLQIGETSYKLDRRGAVVRKQLSCGLPMSIAVPAKAFKGVAARAVENESGQTTVTLELLHHDPELCIPLLCASNMDDISADWHSWSRLMRIPMLILDLEGEPTPVQRMLGELLVEDPIERRKRITTVKHRPFFLRRRKPGVVGPVERLAASELIARN